MDVGLLSFMFFLCVALTIAFIILAFESSGARQETQEWKEAARAAERESDSLQAEVTIWQYKALIATIDPAGEKILFFHERFGANTAAANDSSWFRHFWKVKYLPAPPIGTEEP